MVLTQWIIDDRLFDVKDGILRYVSKQNNEKLILRSYDPYSKFDPSKRIHRMGVDDEDYDDEFIYYCSYGKHTFKFKEYELSIEYNKTSDPLPLCDRIDIKEELIINCDLCDTHEENKKIIEDLFRDRAEEKLKSLKTKIKVFISNECYWQFFSKIPKRDIDTIYLSNKNDIIDDIKQFNESEKLYNEFGRPYKRNYLLYGPPGTGKSSMIIALASLMNLNIYKINLTKGLDDSDLMNSISKIPLNGLLVFEDIDSLFNERETSESNKTFITFSSLLNILDGFVAKTKLITIMTTNHKDKLDDAFLRPGRIDVLVEFKYSDTGQINDICSHFISEDNNDIKLDFINKIKNIKTTSAALTKFLFENIKVKKITNINEDEYINNYKTLTNQYNKTMPMFM